MHGQGYAKEERVCYDVFWGESKSGRSHLLELGPDGGDDVGYADGAEAVIGEKIADGGGGISFPVTQSEEYAGTCLEWAGCDRLRIEVEDSLTAYRILLIVEGDDDLNGIGEMIGGGIPGE